MKVGVIVGRFQTDELTPGHLSLIREASKNSDQVLILIGSTHKPPSHNNPLTFEMRRKIVWEGILGDYNILGSGMNKSCDFATLPLPDHHDEAQWVRNLDAIIHTFYRNDVVTIYVGRDSGMTRCYMDHGGKHKLREVSTPDATSATSRRAGLYNLPEENIDPRSVIWTTQHQYPKVYPTIDCVLMDRAGFFVLIRKKDESKWRFPGGFADPSDKSFEMTCRREVSEECGDIEITDPRYIGSLQIDDWRYRNETDKIITTLFAANVMFGLPRAGDDATELLGFVEGGVQEALVSEHRILWNLYLQWRGNNGLSTFSRG